VRARSRLDGVAPATVGRARRGAERADPGRGRGRLSERTPRDRLGGREQRARRGSTMLGRTRGVGAQRCGLCRRAARDDEAACGWARPTRDRKQADLAAAQQEQRVEVGRGFPQTPVQARGHGAAAVTGRQRAQGVAARDPVAGGHGGEHGLVRRPQSPVVLDAHHAPAGEDRGERHRSRQHSPDRDFRCAGEVDAAVTGTVRRDGRLEQTRDPRRPREWPRRGDRRGWRCGGRRAGPGRPRCEHVAHGCGEVDEPRQRRRQPAEHDDQEPACADHAERDRRGQHAAQARPRFVRSSSARTRTSSAGSSSARSRTPG
jgi:hypothetical protein